MDDASCEADLDLRDMDDLAKGDDCALNRLMDRNGDLVFRFLIRSLGNEQDALDLAQETFVRVYKHRARYRPTRKFRSWLFTIASNLARDRIRWRRRHPEVTLPLPDELEETLSANDSRPKQPDEVSSSNEQSTRVREAVMSLPEDLRLALVLFHFHDHSYDQIAGILKCSIKAVDSRLYRAKKLLRERLSLQCEKMERV